MKRRPLILVTLLTAAITFATLWHTVGHKHLERFKGHCHNVENSTVKNGNGAAPAQTPQQ